VTLILDAGPLVELADARSRVRSRVQRLLEGESGIVVVPAPVTAEVDYLIGQRFGRRGRRTFLTDLAEGRFRVTCLEDAEYRLVHEYDEVYADFDLGLADLSVFVLAYRFQTHRIMTFDERRFRALRPIDGGSFTLFPADEPANA
jgi:predicted nucleic acid-binding protein